MSGYLTVPKWAADQYRDEVMVDTSWDTGSSDCELFADHDQDNTMEFNDRKHGGILNKLVEAGVPFYTESYYSESDSELPWFGHTEHVLTPAGYVEREGYKVWYSAARVWGVVCTLFTSSREDAEQALDKILKEAIEETPLYGYPCNTVGGREVSEELSIAMAKKKLGVKS